MHSDDKLFRIILCGSLITSPGLSAELLNTTSGDNSRHFWIAKVQTMDDQTASDGKICRFSRISWRDLVTRGLLVSRSIRLLSVLLIGLFSKNESSKQLGLFVY